MAVCDQLTPVPRNRLLAALPPEVLARLLPRFELAELPVRHTLYAAGEPIAAAYFPETGWISMLASLESGDAAEVGMVGREGMVGLPLLFGSDRSPLEAMTQGGGTALRMDAATLQEELEAEPGLGALLLRYAMAFGMQVSQTAACNGHHHVEDRLARWLLMSHDRAGRGAFAMTDEFLAMTLGVHRAGISLAARVLQKAGLIDYAAGRVEITDRLGLEAASCGCYDVVEDEFRRLLGRAPAA